MCETVFTWYKPNPDTYTMTREALVKHPHRRYRYQDVWNNRVLLSFKNTSTYIIYLTPGKFNTLKALSSKEFAFSYPQKSQRYCLSLVCDVMCDLRDCFHLKPSEQIWNNNKSMAIAQKVLPFCVIQENLTRQPHRWRHNVLVHQMCLNNTRKVYPR